MTACDAIDITEATPWFENFEGYSGGGEQTFVCWDTPVTDATYHGPFVYCGHSPSCHSGSNSAEPGPRGDGGTTGNVTSSSATIS